MLLFLSDVHCRYAVLNQQVDHAEESTGEAVAGVVILGDLGLFEPFLRIHFRTNGNRPPCPCHFIEGNHEDFMRFDRLVKRYSHVFTHLPRGSVQMLEGHRLLCLGGAQYMDANTTPPGSAITPRDIEHCLHHPPEAADMIITHDCPRNIGVTNQPGLEHYGTPGFEGSERLLEHFRPTLWLFGHHHRWFDAVVEGTRFLGLPQSWEGYALLREGQALAVEHHVHVPLPRRTGFWPFSSPRRQTVP